MLQLACVPPVGFATDGPNLSISNLNFDSVEGTRKRLLTPAVRVSDESMDQSSSCRSIALPQSFSTRSTSCSM